MMSNSDSVPPAFGVGRAAELRRHTPTIASLPRIASVAPGMSRPERPCRVLLELEGAQPGAVFSLRQPSSVLGRKSSADVSLGHPSVSWEHAQVTLHGDDVYIEDLSSHNGTFVNERRIHERTRLEDGDYLRLGGGTIMKFSRVDAFEERALRTLFELTLRDPLTRLYNRRYFDDRLLSECAFARRQHSQLALLLIDIDHFKHFNDTYGHQVGDVVLKLVASNIQKMMRPEDVLARFGGEEFVVIARGTSLRNIHILGERLCQDTQSLVLDLPDRGLNVTVSIGASYTGPGGSEGDGLAAALLKAADRALFEAKAGGRNRTVSAPSS